MFRMMRVPDKGKVAAAVSLNTSTTFGPYKIDLLTGYSICSRIRDLSDPSGNQTFASGVLEVQTLTFDTKANTAHQDFIIVEDAAAVKYAVALTKPVAEVQRLTYEALVATDDGDFVIVEDTAGVKYALAADTTGLAAVTPAGPLWTAADHKALVDISLATDAASVADGMAAGSAVAVAVAVAVAAGSPSEFAIAASACAALFLFTTR